MAEAEAHAEHGHHVISDKVLIQTFVLLLILMIATIFFARLPLDGPKYFPGLEPQLRGFQNLWPLTNAIAVGIAIWKTFYVIQNFMGVKYSTKLVKLWAICGFVGFGLMYIMFFDYAGRAWEPVRGWEKQPSTAFPRDRGSDAGIPYKEYPGTESEGKKE